MTAHACFRLEVQIACGMRTLVDAGSIGPCCLAYKGKWRVGQSVNDRRVRVCASVCAAKMRWDPKDRVHSSRDVNVHRNACARDKYKVHRGTIHSRRGYRPDSKLSLPRAAESGQAVRRP